MGKTIPIWGFTFPPTCVTSTQRAAKIQRCEVRSEGKTRAVNGSSDRTTNHLQIIPIYIFYICIPKTHSQYAKEPLPNGLAYIYINVFYNLYNIHLLRIQSFIWNIGRLHIHTDILCILRTVFCRYTTKHEVHAFIISYVYIYIYTND